jgi:hypothetical protein
LRCKGVFIRDPGGALTYPIVAAGATTTFLEGINDKGWMVGVTSDGTATHGVLFLSSNKGVTYDYPGAGDTAFTGINSGGVITGDYYDASSNAHGFIVRARRAASDETASRALDGSEDHTALCG